MKVVDKGLKEELAMQATSFEAQKVALKVRCMWSVRYNSPSPYLDYNTLTRVHSFQVSCLINAPYLVQECSLSDTQFKYLSSQTLGACMVPSINPLSSRTGANI